MGNSWSCMPLDGQWTWSTQPDNIVTWAAAAVPADEHVPAVVDEPAVVDVPRDVAVVVDEPGDVPHDVVDEPAVVDEPGDVPHDVPAVVDEPAVAVEAPKPEIVPAYEITACPWCATASLGGRGTRLFTCPTAKCPAVAGIHACSKNPFAVTAPNGRLYAFGKVGHPHCRYCGDKKREPWMDAAWPETHD